MRSYNDLYRGFRTFRESAEDAGLIPLNNEVLHTMLDAIERHSCSNCRRLFVIMIFHTDQADGILTAFEDARVYVP